MLYSTANNGTPTAMPAKPNTPPNSKIANMTQKLDKPVELPKILGPRILPSNCCSARMKITKYNACTGLITMIRIVLGIAPINGPKNGMILVTPMITEISSAKD